MRRRVIFAASSSTVATFWTSASAKAGSLALFLCFAAFAGAGAQVGGGSQADASSSLDLPAFGAKTAENPWRRFEIVSLGSFPIMLFYTDFSFDLVSFVAEGFNPKNAPWPFKSEYSIAPNDSQRLIRIGVALGASVAVGVVDALIRASKAAKAKGELDSAAPSN